MVNVCIYVRVSTVDQNYERQISDITNFITIKFGKNINIEIYNEKISGYKNSNKRPQLDKLLNKINSNPNYYQCIYCTELSRLGRNPLETRQLVNDLLKVKKIDICVTTANGGTYFLNPDKSVNETQLIVFGLLMDFSDVEAKQLKDRTRSGKKYNASKGGANGGLFTPYGYINKDKKLAIEPTEALIVKDIFQDYKNGLGMLAIAQKLNNKGVQTKVQSFKTIQTIGGKPISKVYWTTTQINNILTQTLYYGKRTYLDEVFDVPLLAIIDKELFDVCTEIRLGKKGNGRNINTKNVVLLHYLLKCGECGRNYSQIIKKLDCSYICTCRLVEPYSNCGNNSIKINHLDSAIYDMLCKTPKVLEYLSDTVTLKKEINNKIELIENSIPILQSELTKIKNKIKRLVNDYYEENIELEFYEQKKSEWNNEMKNLLTQIETLNKQLANNKQTLIDLDKPTTNMQILIDAKSDRIKLQAIFKQIIQSITIYKIDKQNTRCDIKLQIAGEPLKGLLTLILNKKGAIDSPPIFKYQTFRIFEFDPSEDDGEEYYLEFYDNDKYKNITNWNHVTDNQIILQYTV